MNFLLNTVGAVKLGVFSGVVTALVVAFVFVWSAKIRPGTESLTEAIPVIVISLALVEFLRTYIAAIPSIISVFSWQNLAILLSAVWLSDALVRKYLRKFLK